MQVLGDETVGMHGHGQLETAVAAMLGGRRRVGPGVADPVDLDPHAQELSGTKAGPRRIRANGERHAAGGLSVDGDDLGSSVVHGQVRTDQLQVAVDAVRTHEQVHELRAKQAVGGRGQHLVDNCTHQGTRYTVRLSTHGIRSNQDDLRRYIWMT